MPESARPRVVLLVDDDPMVRSVLRRWAKVAGVLAVVAADGHDALEAFAVQPVIDAVITDVRMPGMDGPSLAASLLAQRPDLPLVFISGFTGLPENPDVPHRPRAAFVAKPFSFDALTSALHAVLGDTPTAAAVAIS